jgi:hypothetical protein
MPGEPAEGQPNDLGFRRPNARPTCDGHASVREGDHLLWRQIPSAPDAAQVLLALSGLALGPRIHFGSGAWLPVTDKHDEDFPHGHREGDDEGLRCKKNLPRHRRELGHKSLNAA